MVYVAWPFWRVTVPQAVFDPQTAVSLRSGVIVR